MWQRHNQYLATLCLADQNIYISPFIVFFSANTHFLKLEYFTSLMGLFSATNAILKRSMIPKEFNYQVIGQVIRCEVKKKNVSLENGAHLNAKTAEDICFVI